MGAQCSQVYAIQEWKKEFEKLPLLTEMSKSFTNDNKPASGFKPKNFQRLTKAIQIEKQRETEERKSLSQQK